MRNGASDGASRSASPARAPVLWAVLLVVSTLVAYAPLRANGFVQYDDRTYLTENEHVQRGLTADGLAWAFNVGHAGNWHPLTWIAHMLDCQLWGLDATAHHLTSLALHAASAVVLLFLLARLTGAPGPSAFVAGVFALHPLHVESVAWAAERKDVLAALLGFLSLSVWTRYCARGGRARFALALALFALGLAAKPMLVSLPLLLLLLDSWPLGRSGTRSTASLVREKLPFFALAAASCVVTYVAQERGGAVSSLDVLPVSARVANAAVSYVAYLVKALWPSDLAVLYPHPMDGLSAWKVGGSLALLAACTWASLRAASRRPWIRVGWLWYLIVLLPVIGIVQVGLQSMADRYTYWALVGPSILVAFGARELSDRAARGALVARAAAFACLAALLLFTRQQVEVWKDDLTLFSHAARVTKDNHMAHFRLGYVLALAGRSNEALSQYRESLRIRPTGVEALNNVGMLLQRAGQLEAAIASFRKALELDPGVAEARANLGSALDQAGRSTEGERELEQALRERPEMHAAHNDLGVLLAKQGRIDQAIERFARAVGLEPGYADAHMNLAMALYQGGRTQEAEVSLRAVLRLEPGNTEARAALDRILGSRASKP